MVSSKRAYSVDARLVRDFRRKLTGATIHHGSATISAYRHAIEAATRADRLVKACEREMQGG